MGRQNVLKGDAHYVQAIDQWLEDIESNHKCAVRIVLGRSVLRRRLHLRVEACEVADGRLASIRVRRTTTHPSGDAVDLVGAILRELTRLDAELTTYANLYDGAAFSEPESASPDKAVLYSPVK